VTQYSRSVYSCGDPGATPTPTEPRRTCLLIRSPVPPASAPALSPHSLRMRLGPPAQPADALRAQIDGVVAHDASEVLGDFDVPTLITFGAHELVCSTRFAQSLKNRISGSELVVFDHLSHAGLHEDPETFNSATLGFLLRHRS
jgi:pimeloyl-ACP methyl ester carboxylesterase